ncbi:MAG: HdeD family acid-resistance protein [Sphingomonadaceae bacterium]
MAEALSVPDDLKALLARRWWLMLLRGALGILFGIIAFANPAVAGLSLLIVFAAFAVVDGVLGLWLSIGRARQGESWAWLGVEAVASLVLGLLVLAFPMLGIAALLLIIGVKAALLGVLLLLSSIRLDGETGQGLMAVSGAISLIFAVLIFVAPLLGARIIIWWIGAWAILFGLALVALAFTLRKVARRLAAAAG